MGVSYKHGIHGLLVSIGDNVLGPGALKNGDNKISNNMGPNGANSVTFYLH